MKAHCSKACSALKGTVFPRHHHIGEKHVQSSEMEQHLVDDARHVFHDTDRQGIRAPLGRHHPGVKIGI